MKGKPFVERLIPGVTFQVFTHENVSIDVAPFVGYRFSGRINAGIGGYRRLTYLKDSDRLKAVNCFGIRTFGSFKVIQNLNAYAEAEYFKNNVSSRYGWHSSERDRSHHWKLNLGVQKRYSMGRNFFGHFIIMYDLVKIRRFPNTEGAAVRFGFDYQIIRKKKDKGQQHCRSTSRLSSRAHLNAADRGTSKHRGDQQRCDQVAAVTSKIKAAKSVCCRRFRRVSRLLY